MSTTPREIIRGALKLIGVVAGGESPSAQEQSDALLTLNDMISFWSTQNLLIFSNTIEDFPLISGQQTYTMGAGGGFNTTRPREIVHAATLDASSSPVNEIPIQILNIDQWSGVKQKLITSTLASKLYVDYSSPLVTLNFWPVPTIANSVRLYSLKPLSSFATVNTTIDLPDGYAMAIRFGLALMLAPEYGRQVDPTVAAIAASTLADIQRANIRPIYMACDQSVVARGRTWDWRTGD